MPGWLDGIQSAYPMRARFPGVPIIYMTGRPDVLYRRGAWRDRGRAPLPKPFTPAVQPLLAMAQRLLAEQPRRLTLGYHSIRLTLRLGCTFVGRDRTRFAALLVSLLNFSKAVYDYIWLAPTEGRRSCASPAG